jgi:hypothetical protein
MQANLKYVLSIEFDHLSHLARGNNIGAETPDDRIGAR